MKDPSLAMQAAVYAALNGSSALAAAMPGRARPFVYDRIPRGPDGAVTATYPFVHVGDDHVVSDADQCHDASTVYCTVHVFSRAVGKVEAKTIMGTVCLALDALLPMSGFKAITHNVDDGPRHLTDPDAQTSHSVATFAYKVGPTA